MKENTVVAFQNPSDFQKDPLTEVLQAGARELLAQAVEAEVSVFLGSHAALVDAAGRRRVVRNGYLPERFIQTGIGPVSVRQPRVRDRGDGAIRFTSAILPRYLRRAKSLEDLLPWLYLKGISTGDFGEALAALLGSSAPGLSASTITRLKEVWGVEAARWQRRDLTAKRYVYFWVDGIYFSARMEEEKQCILVIVGATDKGQKELIAIADGYRESEQSWLEVLLDLKRRGLEMGPQLALGDGALGFWKALRQVYPGAREQRCWVHKTGNVLNKLPKGLQKKAKGRLQDIWMAETRKDAESAFDFFLEAYGPKYDKAAACLAKDRDVLLTFYDFPAEHWKHVRTTNCPSHLFHLSQKPWNFASPPDTLSGMHKIIEIFADRAAFHTEILALRQQVAVLKRKRPRPSLRKADRVFWVILSCLWPGWRHALVIVRPETVIGWHRKGFRLFWTWKSRRGKPGRPPVSREIRYLVRRMSRENTRWGAPRIHGELLKLGFSISQAAVSKYMVRYPSPPSQSWRTFLTNHADCLASIDFFVVPTATFHLLFGFIVLHHERRQIAHFGVTANPTMAWVAQQIREAFPWARRRGT